MSKLILCAMLTCVLSISAADVNRQGAKLISRVKNISVATLDQALPEAGFEQWLQTEAGADTRLEWEVNDCGEQTGSLRDRMLLKSRPV